MSLLLLLLAKLGCQESARVRLIAMSYFFDTCPEVDLFRGNALISNCELHNCIFGYT